MPECVSTRTARPVTAWCIRRDGARGDGCWRDSIRVQRQEPGGDSHRYRPQHPFPSRTRTPPWEDRITVTVPGPDADSISHPGGARWPPDAAHSSGGRRPHPGAVRLAVGALGPVWRAGAAARLEGRPGPGSGRHGRRARRQGGHRRARDDPHVDPGGRGAVARYTWRWLTDGGTGGCSTAGIRTTSSVDFGGRAGRWSPRPDMFHSQRGVTRSSDPHAPEAQGVAHHGDRAEAHGGGGDDGGEQ